MKIEIAQELGLWEKIRALGWGELTAEESGRIGGLMRQRLKKD
ncbi:MAG: small, acid-soluble spore protein, alpha/beta type [Peptococcia bacterium]